jgi:hypothetical protein
MAESDPKIMTGQGGLDHPDHEDRKRAKRDSLFLMTTIASADGAALGHARVRNLSATGLMADCDHMFQKDELVVVALRGVGEVTGHVAWANGQRVGIAFDREIDPQLARKPTHVAPADDMAPYLRLLNAKARFTTR